MSKFIKDAANCAEYLGNRYGKRTVQHFLKDLRMTVLLGANHDAARDFQEVRGKYDGFCKDSNCPRELSQLLNEAKELGRENQDEVYSITAPISNIETIYSDGSASRRGRVSITI